MHQAGYSSPGSRLRRFLESTISTEMVNCASASSWRRSGSSAISFLSTKLTTGWLMPMLMAMASSMRTSSRSSSTMPRGSRKKGTESTICNFMISLLINVINSMHHCTSKFGVIMFCINKKEKDRLANPGIVSSMNIVIVKKKKLCFHLAAK